SIKIGVPMLDVRRLRDDSIPQPYRICSLPHHFSLVYPHNTCMITNFVCSPSVSC
uniref:Uncharacterized protein n=1 Tax=Aegilops tauschii subsp. strangulata TaxID=200361 RepID=A0A453DUU3_AEGTS